MQTRKFKIRINGWLSAMGKLFPKRLHYTCPVPPFHRWNHRGRVKLAKETHTGDVSEYTFKHGIVCKKCGERRTETTHAYRFDGKKLDIDKHLHRINTNRGY